MGKFFVCKFCHRKVAQSYLAQHILREHFERCYTEVIFGEQTTFEESGDISLKERIEEITVNGITEISENKIISRFESK